MKKEPVTLSPNITSTSRDPRDHQLVTLEAHTASSSSSRTSSETEKEIEHLEDQFLEHLFLKQALQIYNQSLLKSFDSKDHFEILKCIVL